MCNISAPVREIIGIAGFERFLTLCETEEQALNYIRGNTETSLRISTESQDGVVILNLSGRVDALSLDVFHSRIDEQISASTQGVVLDFSGLIYISSAGLRAIMINAKSALAQDSGFALCCLPDTIQEIVRIAGFNKVITIRETRAQAIAFIKA